MKTIVQIIEYLDSQILTREDIDTLREYLNTRFDDLVPKIPPGYKVWDDGVNYVIVANSRRQARQLHMKANICTYTNKVFNRVFTEGSNWFVGGIDCPQVPSIYSYLTNEIITL